ncbi:MAG TPA: hypothetical protein ENK43_11355 [Planctomycetes bacterium]|nr:hypothetical protein [Planctomycetota bacterium]
MSIESVSAAVAGSQNITGGRRLDGAGFMKLLTTQIKNQNPLEPLQDSQFIGQLAQLSSLEEAQGQTAALQQLASALQANAGLQGLAQASSLIGRQVSYIDPDLGTESDDTVQSVKFGNGLIQLELESGVTIPLGNVVQIRSDVAGGLSSTTAPNAEPTSSFALGTSSSV